MKLSCHLWNGNLALSCMEFTHHFSNENLTCFLHENPAKFYMKISHHFLHGNLTQFLTWKCYIISHLEVSMQECSPFQPLTCHCTALQSSSTYQKSVRKARLQPVPKLSENPKSMIKLTLNEPAKRKHGIC